MTAPRSPHDAWSAVAQAYQKHIVPSLKPGVEALCRYAGIKRGDRVLDIGCGPGTASFAAHGLGAEVTGVDGAKGMIAVAEELARSKRGITFLEGDLQDLPVPDASFDVVLSSFGIIFAPEPERAVAEVARVLVKGGRLALLAWPRAGAVGRYYDTIDRHIAPIAGADPHRWADLNQMRAWLGDAFDAVASAEVELPFTASSPEAAWETLRGSTGRVALAYQALTPGARAALDKEIVEFFWTCRKSDGTVVWPRKARMIRATRRARKRAAPVNPAHSVIAVLAGYLVLAVLIVGVDSLAAAVLGVNAGMRPTRSYLLTALLGVGAAAGLGGWLTARLAPVKTWYHLAALALLAVVLTPPTGASGGPPPDWYRRAAAGVALAGVGVVGLVKTGALKGWWTALRSRARSGKE